MKLYQAFIASNADICTALFAGRKPAVTPINTENSIANPISHSGITDRFEADEAVSPIYINVLSVSDTPEKEFIILETPQLTAAPTVPQIKPINAASIRNSFRMSARLHPRALRIPISLVLSVIDIIMVLAIPIAATKRDTAPNPASISCF